MPIVLIGKSETEAIVDAALCTAAPHGCIRFTSIGDVVRSIPVLMGKGIRDACDVSLSIFIEAMP
jgi:hypothetical protein